MQMFHSTRATAKKIGVPEIHLRRLIKSGYLKPDARSDREILFLPQTVDTWRRILTPAINFRIG